MKTTLALALVLTFFAGSAAAADASVSGIYRAEGKDTPLRFARVAKGVKAYSNDPAILFAFTEKNASDAKDIGADAIAFSHTYGSAITMNIFKNSDGVYEVAESAFHHSASDKAGGNASGILQLKNVVVANGSISGEVYTKPDTDMFGAKVDVDLNFKATMPK
ncbi:MAG: hypothetical protein ABIS07_16075 [Dokdonella sp.]